MDCYSKIKRFDSIHSFLIFCIENTELIIAISSFFVIYSGTEKSILSIRATILSYSMTKHRIHASPAIIGLVAAIAVVMTSTIVTPAFAIKFFFNCMTDKANEHGKLTLDDVHMCLYKEYGVYNKAPYGTFVHSSRGSSGSSGR